MIILSIDLGIKNLSYAVVDCSRYKTGTYESDDVRELARMVSRDVDIIDWESINILEYNDCHSKTVTIEKLTQFMLNFFSSMSLIPDKVMIESQPAGFHRRANLKTKILSHVIQSFYYMKGIPCAFICPKHKIKICEPIPDSIKGKNRYNATKQSAVNACLQYVHDDVNRSKFESISKQDDMADSYLQLLVVLALEELKIQKKIRKKRKLKK